jgi:hypothetical protein
MAIHPIRSISCAGSAHAWSSDLSGVLGTGTDIWVKLPAGDHQITMTATDPPGLQAQAAIPVRVRAGDGTPSAKIVSPVNGTYFRIVGGTTGPVTFEGTATDPEQGVLGGAALEWSSDLDGPLGQGSPITVTFTGSSCVIVSHQITLRARDADGHVGEHSITVRVGDIC